MQDALSSGQSPTVLKFSRFSWAVPKSIRLPAHRAEDSSPAATLSLSTA